MLGSATDIDSLVVDGTPETSTVGHVRADVGTLAKHQLTLFISIVLDARGHVLVKHRWTTNPESMEKLQRSSVVRPIS